MYNIVLLTDLSHELFLQRTLGIHKVAAALRNHGYAVRIINFLHCFSVEEIVSMLEHSINEHTLFVGVNPFFYKHIEQVESLDQWSWEKGGRRFGPRQLGAMIPHGIKYNRLIAETIQSCNPRCKLVLGGPDAQDLSYIRDYDYTVIGYADCSIVNLANHLASGVELSNSRRSIYGSCIIDDAQASGYDFVNTPMRFHQSDFIDPCESLSIEISRGCVFQCAFCSYPLNGKRKNDHVKLEQVLEDEFLYNYKSFGTTRYLFSDDTFNDSIDKINMIARISRRLPFQLEYWAYIRLDLLSAHPETIDTLFDSGLRACHFGIETLNPRTASIIGKGGNRLRMADTVHYIKSKYGNSVSLNGSFIFGLPEESVSSMKNTAEFLVDGGFGLDSWTIYPLQIFGSSNRYQSNLDLRYEQYGYTLGPWREDWKAFEWKNAETDFAEMVELSAYYNKYANEVSEKKLNGSESFYIASSTGFDLEYSLNKPIRTFDWHSVELAKHQKVRAYRERLFSELGMPLSVDNLCV